MASSLCWTSASCLHWKQAYGPSEPWEIIAGTNGKNPPHSVTYGHCLIFENTHPPPRKCGPCWVCELWPSTQAKLAHTPYCLFEWLTECSEHIFPSLAASCSYWLTCSLFGKAQDSCANAAARTDGQLWRVLQEGMKLLTMRLQVGSVSSLGASDLDPYHFLPVAAP